MKFIFVCRNCFYLLAVHSHTAAELIYDRVDSDKPLIGMTNFKGEYITKDDVKIAKAYFQ
jgi:hypothetical protein